MALAEAAALESALAVARRVCERELAPDGYAVSGLEAVELLAAEAAAAGYPLVAELISDSAVFRAGDPARRAERPPVLSPFGDRFLSVEISCRAAIAIEIERLLETPDAAQLAELAREQDRPALAELLGEGLDLRPALGDSLSL